MECSYALKIVLFFAFGYLFRGPIVCCLGLRHVLPRWWWRLWWWWDGVWEEDLEAEDVVMREEGARERWARAVWAFLVRAWEAVAAAVVVFWGWATQHWEREGR